MSRAPTMAERTARLLLMNNPGAGNRRRVHRTADLGRAIELIHKLGAAQGEHGRQINLVQLLDDTIGFLAACTTEIADLREALSDAAAEISDWQALAGPKAILAMRGGK